MNSSVIEVIEKEPVRAAGEKLEKWNSMINPAERIVTIHQPNYMPWIGLFSKASLADCLVLYDNAQYEKNGVINRNKIRTEKGSCYLTVPVGKYPTDTRILDVTLPLDKEWRRDHWNKLQANYNKAPFFKNYAGFFEDVFQQEFQTLPELNERILRFLLSCFKINVEIVKASKLTVDTSLRKTDLMLAYLKNVNAGIYLSGPSGRNYLQFEKFPDNNITLQFFKFEHPVYPQRFPGFEPKMSAVDLLFNMGPDSAEIVRNAAGIEYFQPLKSGDENEFGTK